MPLDILTLKSIIKALKVIIDFSIVWILIYYTLRVVRNNSRTVQIFKGVVLVILVRFIAYYFDLKVVLALADFVIQYGVLVFVIIFQQEIRGLLERLGKSTVFSSLHTLSGNERERLIGELVNAAETLSNRKTGALIALEQGHSLADYIKTGTPINSALSADLLTSIFVTTTPLHDGAVIVQGDRIACASAYFPPTSLDLPSSYGARHRAAIGLSEITDSVTIVVSEESGKISVAENGKLTEMTPESLKEFLSILIQNTEKEVSQRVETKVSRKINLSRFNVDPIRIQKIEEEDRVRPTFFNKNKKEETDKDEDKLFKRKELADKKKSFFRKKRVQEPPEDIDSLKKATSRNKEEATSDDLEHDGGNPDGK